MSTRINTNVEALNAQRNLGVTAGQFAKSVEKLSSGLRINRAADDAAGLAISQKLDAQVRGLNQAQRNAQDGISMIQTAEGALNEVHTMLQRIRELAVQASNSTLGASDMSSVNDEMQQLSQEITRITGSTTFNGQHLLTGDLSTHRDAVAGGTLAASYPAGGSGNTSTLAVTGVDMTNAKAGTTYTITGSGSNVTLTGGNVSQTIAVSALTSGAGAQTLNFDKLGVQFSFTATSSAGTGATAADVATALNSATVISAAADQAAKYQVGANSGETITVNFEAAGMSNLTSLNSALGTFNGAQNFANAQSIISGVDSALDTISTARGKYGAAQNRLEHTIASISVASENLTASASRIKDLDVASEMVNFTKTQILQQAGTAILAQANSAPQNILSLLR